MTAHAPVMHSGSYTRPAEPPTPKAVGDSFRFVSAHLSVKERSGQVCTVVEAHDKGWPFVIEFADTKRCNAVHSELREISEAGR
jgi:hypothetical protein